MSTATLTSTPTRSRITIVIATLLAALAVNELIYLIGHAISGSFVFHQGGKVYHVNAGAIAILTAPPVLIGMALAALLSVRWAWTLKAALVVAPVAAVATIFIMTIPADFDTASTVTLALTHLALAPVCVAGLLALGRVRAVGRAGS